MSRQKPNAKAIKRRDASRGIEKLVRSADILQYKFPPFDTWDELKSAYEEAELGDFNSQPTEEIPLKLGISLHCLSVLHTYISTSSSIVLFRLLDEKKKIPKLQASFSILSGMATDVGAIKLLCEHGYDIQAKTVVRSLREKIDYLIAIQLDRSFSVNFIRSEESSENNKFWHQRVSKGKLIKNISRRLAHYSLDGKSPIDEIWLAERKKLDLWLGEAVHPSHTTGFLSAFPTFGSSEDGEIGLFGHPSELSVPTARTVLGFFIEIMFIINMRIITKNHNTKRKNKKIVENIDLINRGRAASEKFLTRCSANSSFGPNLDYYKLQYYLMGYAIKPIDEDIDWKQYELEIFKIMKNIVDLAVDKIEKMESEIPE